jgi:hypothetical protein
MSARVSTSGKDMHTSADVIDNAEVELAGKNITYECRDVLDGKITGDNNASGDDI